MIWRSFFCTKESKSSKARTEYVIYLRSIQGHRYLWIHNQFIKSCTGIDIIVTIKTTRICSTSLNITKFFVCLIKNGYSVNANTIPRDNFLIRWNIHDKLVVIPSKGRYKFRIIDALIEYESIWYLVEKTHFISIVINTIICNVSCIAMNP